MFSYCYFLILKYNYMNLKIIYFEAYETVEYKILSHISYTLFKRAISSTATSFILRDSSYRMDSFGRIAVRLKF